MGFTIEAAQEVEYSLKQNVSILDFGQSSLEAIESLALKLYFHPSGTFQLTESHSPVIQVV